MVPNGYDTEVHATVEIDPADPAGALITYKMYGAGCGTSGPCNGPGMFVTCERAVNHGSSMPYVDIGVGNAMEQSVWLSDKIGYLGERACSGFKCVTSIISKWVKFTNVARDEITF